MKVHLELDTGIDPTQWASRYARQVAPDAVRHGFEHLVNLGHDLDIRPVSRSRGRAGIASALSRLSGAGLSIAESYGFGRRRREADVILSWDQRRAIPAGLRAAQRGGPPVVAKIDSIIEASEREAWLTKRLVAAGVPGLAHVVATTDVGANALVERWGLSGDTVHSVSPGIDVDFWIDDPVSSEERITERTVVIPDLGRFGDHDMLASIKERVSSALGDVRFVDTAAPELAGEDGYVQLRSSLRTASVVLVCPRVNAHGAGLTPLLQAMATSAAVVATNTGGLAEVVHDGVDGLLCEARRAREASDYLIELLRSPGDVQVLGKNARETVLEAHTPQLFAGRIEAVLRRLG